MLQVAASVPAKPVLYVTTEESAAAVAQRARRISPSSDVFILAENNVAAIIDASRKAGARTLIVDSLQMLLPDSGAPPGALAGVREAAALLGDYAHQSPGAAVFMVGHITKTGFIAGPKLVEHMVDVVLYFETEGSLALRLLRARKNRFASTESVGVFAMAESGLVGVEDPSGFFLEEERERLSGTAPAAALVGDRVLFLDVQALVSTTHSDRPGARRVSGLDANRASMVLAVLEKRLGMNLYSKDVFLNVAGGVKIIEPASDLAVAAAVMSSVADLPFPHRSVFIGEVGLGGEVRRVPMLPLRIKEAARMGFKRIAVPKSNHKELRATPSVQIVFVDNVAELRKMLSEA
jgi:DNA repair protein RadA/Sms